MRPRQWDTRVVWLEGRQCWWWYARHVEIGERYGPADSKDAAQNAMNQAIEQAERRPSGGTAT